MLKRFISKILIASTLLFFGFLTSIEAVTFKIASYNVENLFDLNRDGTEYSAYLPYNHYGWNRDMLDIKTSSLARVIKGLNAEVVALQEIESKKALILLVERLKHNAVNYPYYKIAAAKPTSVKCAVISKFPIINKKEIKVDNDSARNILKITLNIEGAPFIVFVNHWKSRRGPESCRIKYAKALKKEIDMLPADSDFILTGDFNSCYNEYKTIKYSKKLNDTKGKTGINHILMTVKGSDMVNENFVKKQEENEYLYNLWLELGKGKRWSYIFAGQKRSLDHMIMSKGLYDNKGIAYVDNSFGRFTPEYLFYKKGIYRWQRARRGKGRHLGKGYSDHLPIFAYFSTKP